MRSRVYEYGGGPYAILANNRIIFSNFKDKSVYILDVDSGSVRRLLECDTLRYGDFEAHPGNEPWVLAVQEDHEIDEPEQVKNYVVAINGDFYLVYGTSCSSPVSATIFSAINDARLAAGKGPIGFINPTVCASPHSYG